MPEDNADRTEEPTARRLQEARDEGRVARSIDLAAAIGLGTSLILLVSFGGGILGGMMNLVRSIGGIEPTSAQDLTTFANAALDEVFRIMVPVLGLTMLLSAAGALGQFGLLWVPKKLKFDPNHINPIKGFGRIFSRDSVQRLVIAVFKLVLVSAVAWWTINAALIDVIHSGAFETATVLMFATDVAWTLALRLTILLLILGIIDYLYQKWSLTQSLKMTKQEVKDEMKRMDGDPLLKRRQRETQVRLSAQRLQADVPKADVVITNPTEYAVALTYSDEDERTAPKVVAKGTDLLAARIRQIAQQNGIPIVARPPLARALYAEVRVGAQIPHKFYRAVAEVLAYVYQLSGRTVSAS